MLKLAKDTSVDKDSSLFIINLRLEHMLVFLLLTLDMKLLAEIIFTQNWKWLYMI